MSFFNNDIVKIILSNKVGIYFILFISYGIMVFFYKFLFENFIKWFNNYFNNKIPNFDYYISEFNIKLYYFIYAPFLTFFIIILLDDNKILNDKTATLLIIMIIIIISSFFSILLKTNKTKTYYFIYLITLNYIWIFNLINIIFNNFNYKDLKITLLIIGVVFNSYIFDYIGFLKIFANELIKIDDLIIINNKKGIVEKIYFSNTILKNFNNEKIIIPNSLFLKNEIRILNNNNL